MFFAPEISGQQVSLVSEKNQRKKILEKRQKVHSCKHILETPILTAIRSAPATYLPKMDRGEI